MAENMTYKLERDSIKGAAEAKKILMDLPDDVRDRLPKDARGMAGDVAGQIADAFPAYIAFIVPSESGYGGGFTIGNYDVEAQTDVSDSPEPVGSVGQEDRQVPLFRVIVTGTNAVYADMGQRARQDSTKREAGVDHLTRVYGVPSRFAWPIAHKAHARGVAQMERSGKKIQQDYTAALAEPSE